MERLKRYLQIIIFLFLPVAVIMKEEMMPDIVDAATVYTVELNSSICLPCSVKRQWEDSRRKVLFYWSKDNSTVWNWPRYRVKRNKCLRIRNVIHSDAGTYVCNARNSYGKQSVVRQLIVLGEKIGVTNKKDSIVPRRNIKLKLPVPHFLRETLKTTADIVTTTVYFGRRGKLKCAVEGFPSPKITWFRNGVQLKDSNKTSIREKTFLLVIKNFERKDEGKYTCFAESSASKVNMSFVVIGKMKEVVKLPKTQTVTLTVRNGMNLSLSCSSPNDQVKLMQWHIPLHTPRAYSPGRSVFRDVGKDFKRAKKLLEPTVVNKSRIETFNVYNISKAVHEGTYKCLVLYKNKKTPFPVKIVYVKFINDGNSNPHYRETSGDSTLILFIGIPVFAGVLSMVMVLICIRCYRYHKKKALRLHVITSGVTSVGGDEEDALSMQILPATYPTDSLRMHKKDEISETKLGRLNSFEKRKTSRSSSLDRKERRSPPNSANMKRKDSYNLDTSNTCELYSSTPPETRNEGGLHKNNSSQDNTSLTKSTHSISKDNLPDGSTPPLEPSWSGDSKWPGEKLLPGDLDYIDFNEDEKLLYYNSCNNNKDAKNKHCSNGSFEKRHKRKDKKRIKSREEECSLPLVDDIHDAPPHCGAIDEPLPQLNLPDSPEDDDLLQREMKNWEPLIRDSSCRKDTDEIKCALLNNSRCMEQAQMQIVI